MAIRTLFIGLLITGLALIGCSKKQEIEQEKSYISGQEMFLLSAAIGAPEIEVTDSVYQLLPGNSWTNYFPIDITPYHTNRYDCDDYAIIAWAYAREEHAQRSDEDVGIAVGVIGFVVYDEAGVPIALHAANILLTDDYEILVWDVKAQGLWPFPEDIIFIWW